MKTVFAKYACTALLASCVMLQAPLAQAAMVSTDEAVSAQQIQQDREKVRSFLDRATVQEKLHAMGVQSAFAKDRVDALTNEEVVALAKKIDSLPAGGMLGTTDIILILLLVILIAVIV